MIYKANGRRLENSTPKEYVVSRLRHEKVVSMNAQKNHTWIMHKKIAKYERKVTRISKYLAHTSETVCRTF